MTCTRAWINPELWTNEDREKIKNLNDPDLLDSLQRFDPTTNFAKMNLSELDAYFQCLQTRLDSKYIRLLVAVLDAVAEEEEAAQSFLLFAQAAEMRH